MASIVVRGLDPETVARLKARAARNRRSMEAEVRHVLEWAASDAESWQALDAELESLRGAIPLRDWVSEALAGLREARERV